MKHSKHSVDFFDDNDGHFFKVINNILALATLVSILSIVLETVGSLAKYHSIFKAIEYLTTALFTIEYGMRFYYAKSKFKYLTSFFGIIDLLAIIPTYLGIGNLTFLKSARALRILRFLRMVRLAKLTKGKLEDVPTNSIYALNIEIYAVALFTSLLVLGTALYIFEHGAEYAKDIPSGMYWAFKVILGGMSFQQPDSLPGTLILITGRFVSLILLGLMLNLMGTVMRKILIGTESDGK